jgi:phosphomevalonate kinase
MSVTASAPGKLVIAGDYAVLEGAPAVVMAINRRAHVIVDDGSEEGFLIDAPDLGVKARGRLCGQKVQWSDEAAAAALDLVTCVLAYFAAHDALPPRFAARLDTHAFFSPYGRKDKLGLGSSAALAVALAGAIGAVDGHEAPDLAAMMAMHRDLQNGRGSGLDIASALLGGVLVYRLHQGRARTQQQSWPRALALCCVWSGRPASTGSALAQLAQWRQQQAGAYRALMDELTNASSAVAAALAGDDAEAMLEALAAYAHGLDRLGGASGIDIVCDEHRAIAGIAAECGVVYKTCGAGGGDVGIACATDTERLTHFARKVDAAGFYVLDVGVDTQGLMVQTPATSNRRQAWTTCA